MRHICVAIPSKTGMVPIEQQHCYMDIGAGCIAHGAQLSIMTIKFNPYIQHVRNRFVANCLADPRFTDLLFVDDDLSWDWGATERILRPDVDVIAGVYPKKSNATRFTGKPMDGAEIGANGLLEMLYVPTGFLRISRRCLEIMVKSYEHLEYREYIDVEGQPGMTKQHALFWVELALNADGELCMQGEDVNFCAKWAALGGKIWADTTLKFRHHGMNDWYGCYGDFIAGQKQGQQIAAE